jgi:AcrR family transcriptional regulator
MPPKFASPPTAQQRRTRKAIVEAASRLLQARETPSIAEVAAEADVSRRTVYLYFPNVEQLLADAALEQFSRMAIDADLDALDELDDIEERVALLVRTVQVKVLETEHLGRTIMRTAALADRQDDGTPPRGYRRVAWIERALAPARDRLTPERFEELVSALTLLIGWEAALVLRDVRGLDTAESVAVSERAARDLTRAALAEAEAASPNVSSSG